MRLLSLAWAALLGTLASAQGDDSPMFGGRPDRNMVSSAKGLPTSWGGPQKKNVKWVADLGSHTYANPTVAGGRVYIGTNNGRPRDPEVKGDRGVFMCFSAADGKFLWQAVHEKLPAGDAEDFKDVGVCSTPAVAGDRVYYVSNRAELVCVDALGFSDGENDGPFREEKRAGPQDADVAWILDMREHLGVTPFQASASSPLVVGDLVYVVTGNGIDEQTHKAKNPDAPSFLAVHRATGQVAWKDASPGERIIEAQWGSPAFAVVDGRPQVAFPGGDGWIYAFEPESGKLLWKFDGNAHEKGVEHKKLNFVTATPVYAGHRVIIGMGKDTESPGPPGCLRAIDARKSGDITRDGELWRLSGEDFGRTISNVTVHEGLVYAVELDGFVNCIDLETGKRVWRHDLLSTVWGSPLVADGKVYVRTGEGETVILAAGREKKVMTKVASPDPKFSHGSVIVAGGVLYMAGDTKLYAVAGEK